MIELFTRSGPKGNDRTEHFTSALPSESGCWRLGRRTVDQRRRVPRSPERRLRLVQRIGHPAVRPVRHTFVLAVSLSAAFCLAVNWSNGAHDRFPEHKEISLTLLGRIPRR